MLLGNGSLASLPHPLANCRLRELFDMRVAEINVIEATDPAAARNAQTRLAEALVSELIKLDQTEREQERLAELS